MHCVISCGLIIKLNGFFSSFFLDKTTQNGCHSEPDSPDSGIRCGTPGSASVDTSGCSSPATSNGSPNSSTSDISSSPTRQLHFGRPDIMAPIHPYLLPPPPPVTAPFSPMFFHPSRSTIPAYSPLTPPTHRLYPALPIPVTNSLPTPPPAHQRSAILKTSNNPFLPRPLASSPITPSRITPPPPHLTPIQFKPAPTTPPTTSAVPSFYMRQTSPSLPVVKPTPKPSVPAIPNNMWPSPVRFLLKICCCFFLIRKTPLISIFDR